MPQLTVTSDQVDPLTQVCIFFFKCKNMNRLKNKVKKTFFFTHKGTKILSEFSSANCYLFTTLSKFNSHALTREELPGGGRLAQREPRLVTRGQGIQLEGLSKLLDLLQSFSPLLHPFALNNHLQSILLFLCCTGC